MIGARKSLIRFFKIILLMATVPTLLYVVVLYVVMPAALPVKVAWQVHPLLQTMLRAHKVAVYVHVVPSAVALAVGLLQFRAGAGALRPTYHRVLGRLYAGTVVLGGFSGLYLAVHSFAGLSAQLGFGLLAVLWLATTAVAVRKILKKEIDSHREWMVRSYALTLAGVMLRIYNVLWFRAGYELPDFHAMNAWLCWVPNLLIAEVGIRMFRSRRASFATTQLNSGSAS